MSDWVTPWAAAHQAPLSMGFAREERLSGLPVPSPKIIAFAPITAWLIEGEKMEVVTDFVFLGFKITADGDCSHEIR